MLVIHAQRASTRLGRGGRQMSIFPSLPDISALSDKRREFSESRLIGCSPSEVYDVVADLNRYGLSVSH